MTGSSDRIIDVEDRDESLVVGPDHANDLPGGSEGGEGGDGGESGFPAVSNAEFIAAVFQNVPDGAFAAVSSIAGNPKGRGYPCARADQTVERLPRDSNNYFNCSTFHYGVDGSFKARKPNCAAYHVVMLDDVGTKVDPARLSGLAPSFLIETSPGNYQAGFILSAPITDQIFAARFLNGLIEAKLCDPGANGPSTRWARLPVGINGKPEHASEGGSPFRCRLVEWRPAVRYSPEEIVEGLHVVLPPVRPTKALGRTGGPRPASLSGQSGEVLTRPSAENRVIAALKARGLYKTPLGSGKHDITCPWVSEHTGAVDHGSAYFEPDENFPRGGYCCQHSHGATYGISALLDFLGISNIDARNKIQICVTGGEIHRVVNAAEEELARRGRHFQAGGLIVSVSTDALNGDPSIVPTSVEALTLELSAIATWLKYDGRSGDWITIDPPVRHTKTLYGRQIFPHLPPLAGLTRQPYFRQCDGVLVQQPGYDAKSQRFAVFDPRQFEIGKTDMESARNALRLLESLLSEVPFACEHDRAAALAAMFTAAVRPSLPRAPAFHVRAPVMGSGKSYLCEIIASFAGPGGSEKVSYPATGEEATKLMLSVLLPGPACIEFDDMHTDWIAHGVINRIITSESITERILGLSKVATVSTRTLFLGSGNNVGPERDLLRRVLTIHLDAHCATPATRNFQGSPLRAVREDRGRFVSAILTIILAWREAGCPRPPAGNIVTFDGEWSDYCRYPLMWLGLPDPATALLNQVGQDAAADLLGNLMSAWHSQFGSAPTTLRKALMNPDNDLREAIEDLEVTERYGEINRSKLGQYLKRSAGRVVGGLKLLHASSDGRPAWKVVSIE